MGFPINMQTGFYKRYKVTVNKYLDLFSDRAPFNTIDYSSFHNVDLLHRACKDLKLYVYQKLHN